MKLWKFWEKSSEKKDKEPTKKSTKKAAKAARRLARKEAKEAAKKVAKATKRPCNNESSLGCECDYCKDIESYLNGIDLERRTHLREKSQDIARSKNRTFLQELISMSTEENKTLTSLYEAEKVKNGQLAYMAEQLEEMVRKMNEAKAESNSQPEFSSSATAENNPEELTPQPQVAAAVLSQPDPTVQPQVVAQPAVPEPQPAVFAQEAQAAAPQPVEDTLPLPPEELFSDVDPSYRYYLQRHYQHMAADPEIRARPEYQDAFDPEYLQRFDAQNNANSVPLPQYDYGNMYANYNTPGEGGVYQTIHQPNGEQITFYISAKDLLAEQQYQMERAAQQAEVNSATHEPEETPRGGSHLMPNMPTVVDGVLSSSVATEPGAYKPDIGAMPFTPYVPNEMGECSTSVPNPAQAYNPEETNSQIGMGHLFPPNMHTMNGNIANAAPTVPDPADNMFMYEPEEMLQMAKNQLMQNVTSNVSNGQSSGNSQSHPTAYVPEMPLLGGNHHMPQNMTTHHAVNGQPASYSTTDHFPAATYQTEMMTVPQTGVDFLTPSAMPPNMMMSQSNAVPNMMDGEPSTSNTQPDPVVSQQQEQELPPHYGRRCFIPPMPNEYRNNFNGTSASSTTYPAPYITHMYNNPEEMPRDQIIGAENPCLSNVIDGQFHPSTVTGSAAYTVTPQDVPQVADLTESHYVPGEKDRVINQGPDGQDGCKEREKTWQEVWLEARDECLRRQLAANNGAACAETVAAQQQHFVTTESEIQSTPMSQWQEIYGGPSSTSHSTYYQSEYDNTMIPGAGTAGYEAYPGYH